MLGIAVGIGIASEKGGVSNTRCVLTALDIMVYWRSVESKRSDLSLFGWFGMSVNRKPGRI